MSDAAVLAAALLALPAAWYPPGREPETEAQRVARYGVIADAIDHASRRATACEGAGCAPLWPWPRDELVAVLAAQGWWETRYAHHVHAGRCRRHECDTRNGRARAVSPWQIQMTALVPRAEWSTLTGTGFEPTERAAYAAAKVLASSRARCAKSEAWAAPTIAMYATGARCRWRGARVRAATVGRLLVALRATR